MSEEVILVLGIVLAAGAVSAIFFTQFGSEVLSVVTGKLNAQQISDVASAAGFSGDNLTRAVAIALAESGGNPKAHGDTSLGSGTGSFGLWQIYSDAHPEFGPDFTTLYDPQTNANAAFKVFQDAGNSFNPWSTYKNGAWEAHINDAAAATGFPV